MIVIKPAESYRQCDVCRSKKEVHNTDFYHKGFRDYTQIALCKECMQELSDELLSTLNNLDAPIVDDTWQDVLKKTPRKTGIYWAICGDGIQRKVRYVRGYKGDSGWMTTNRFYIPNSWNGIACWKPYDPDNPCDN